MNNILITGGAGFIGSNLADYLVQDEQNKITIVDDLSMGRIKNIPHSANVTFFEKSITDFEFMEQLLTTGNFDYIYMLAGVASVADSIVRPYETHEVNQEANIFLLETIRKNTLPVKKILFASSAAVYGDDPILPKNEESNIVPLTPYAIDKFASEKYVINYGTLYDIPTVAVRFFNVYGPKQNPESPYSGVISILTECLKYSKDFIVYGDGEQTRDFIYIRDVIDALLLLTINDKANCSGVYNIATGSSVSLNDMISNYEVVSSNKLNRKYKESRKGDIKYSAANIDRLKQLGFSPKYTILDGLGEYWKSINE